RRGGMGTGMPSFGPIFTPDETWMLVDYLWAFVFDLDPDDALTEAVVAWQKAKTQMLVIERP
ncbi:MAG: cytochrome c, partial [Phycisphaerales bacterium]